MGKALNLLEQAQTIRQVGAIVSAEDRHIAAYARQMAQAAETWNHKYDARNPVNFGAVKMLSRLFSYITIEARKAGYDEIVVPFKPDEPVAIGLKDRINELLERERSERQRRNGGAVVDEDKITPSLAKIAFQTSAFVAEKRNINPQIKTCLDLPLAAVVKKGRHHG